MKVTTNNVPRDLLPLSDVPENARGDFDYVNDDDAEANRFFQYCGRWYDANEFTVWTGPKDSPLATWDGVQADTFFSAVAIRFPVDRWTKQCDLTRVVVGLILS